MTVHALRGSARGLFLALTVCAISTVHAGVERVGPTLILGDDVSGVPLVAGRGEFGFVAAWDVPSSNTPNATTRSKVRLFDMRGTPVGPVLQVNPDSLDAFALAFLSGNHQGRFVLGGFRTIRGPAPSCFPELHVYDENAAELATVLPSQAQFQCSTEGPPFSLTGAIADSGNFLALYVSGPGSVAREFGSDGQPRGDEIPLGSAGSRIAVEPDAADGFWLLTPVVSGGRYVWGRRHLVAGQVVEDVTVQGPGEGVSGGKDPSRSTFSGVGRMRPDGEVVNAWSEGSKRKQLLAQRVGPEGSTTGPAAAGGADKGVVPGDVGIGPAGEFVVAWLGSSDVERETYTDYGETYTIEKWFQTDVRVSAFSSDGVPRQAGVAIGSFDAQGRTHLLRPAVGTAAGEHFMVVWGEGGAEARPGEQPTDVDARAQVVRVVSRDFPLGTKVGLKRTSSGEGTLKLVSKDPLLGVGRGPGSVDDPMMHGGQLRVTAGDPLASDWTEELPSAGWGPRKKNTPGSGYRYKSDGAVRKVILSPGKSLRVAATEAVLGTALENDPRPVRVALRLGEQRYCFTFSAGTFAVGHKFAMKSAPRATECPGDVPTSTVTTTTTSTTLAGGCFVDQGSTVLDSCKGLEWEKKDGADAGEGTADPENPHDVDNLYTWAGRCTFTGVLCQPNAAAATTCAAQTGGATGCGECSAGGGVCDVDTFGDGTTITTVWDWVNQVNAATFAGHGDWQLPTSAGTALAPTGEPAELESIVDLTRGGCASSVVEPCIDPIFGPTGWQPHWSASSVVADPASVWRVDFFGGVVATIGKRHSLKVRAVRSGS